MAHPTLHIQRFAPHGSRNLTNTFCYVFIFVYVPGFHVFLERRSPDMWQVRLTAFPELRFMRRAVHGSSLNAMRVPAQLSEKPSDQRMTRLQPMLETQIIS